MISCGKKSAVRRRCKSIVQKTEIIHCLLKLVNFSLLLQNAAEVFSFQFAARIRPFVSRPSVDSVQRPSFVSVITWKVSNRCRWICLNLGWLKDFSLSETGWLLSPCNIADAESGFVRDFKQLSVWHHWFDFCWT